MPSCVWSAWCEAAPGAKAIEPPASLAAAVEEEVEDCWPVASFSGPPGQGHGPRTRARQQTMSAAHLGGGLLHEARSGLVRCPRAARRQQ
eukprot:2210944-Pyramimonas_sp.AAC.1